MKFEGGTSFDQAQVGIIGFVYGELSLISICRYGSIFVRCILAWNISMTLIRHYVISSFLFYQLS
jgi:hypothetical protein